MEALALNTVSPTVHWEDDTSCIYVVEYKTFRPRVKKINITVCFLQESFYNGFFVPKYEKYSVISVDMCTKPCLGPIIHRIAKYINFFRFYP